MLKKLRMAVCELDEGYKNRLVDYLLRQEGEQFEIVGFSGEKEYLEADAKEGFEILLFGDHFFQEEDTYQNKEYCFYLSSGTISPQQEGKKILLKYQPADKLLREILLHLGNLTGRQEKRRVFLQDRELITSYSPWNDRMQTPFVLAAAEELAKNGRKKVLYLNFSVCSGFCQNTGIEKEMDMGDLFYLLREGENEFLAKMRGSIYALGSFSVIPPPENPRHYMEWTEEEVELFFRLLLEKTDYEIVLLDISCLIPGFFEILEKSGRIWLLKEYGQGMDPGLAEVRSLLKKRKKGLEEKVKEVFLPKNQGWREDGRYQIEKFYMGEPGNCARKLLREEDEVGYRADEGEYSG